MTMVITMQKLIVIGSDIILHWTRMVYLKSNRFISITNQMFVSNITYDFRNYIKIIIYNNKAQINYIKYHATTAIIKRV